jgi:hypothetical protein
VDARRRFDECAGLRTAKSCGPDASRLASSRRKFHPPVTVSITPDHRGEHEVTVNHCVRECRVNPGEPVVTMLVWFYFFHARLRVHWAPGVPHALFGQLNAQPRTHRAAGMRRCVLGRHHPRKRVIQYSRDADDESRSCGVLDTPLGAFAKASAAHRRTPAKPWRRRVAEYDEFSQGRRRIPKTSPRRGSTRRASSVRTRC